MNLSSTTFLEALSEVPFDKLMHFQGRATDIPGIISVIEQGDAHASRMALVTLANLVEQKGALIMLSPVMGSYLLYKLEHGQSNKDLIVRIVLKLAKAVGLQWETFIDSQEFDHKEFDFALYQEGSPYLWPEFIDEQTDELSWGTRTADVLFDDPWFYTFQVLQRGLPILNSLEGIDLITQGFVFEINTIIHMVTPQKRFPLAQNFELRCNNLLLVPLMEQYSDQLKENLTPAVTKYLSFDSLNHPALLAQYISHCKIEYERGAAVNLVILDATTKEFLGCCGLHDISTFSIELGIWLKEKAQGKGIATEVIKSLIELCFEHFGATDLIYSVEKGNDASAQLAQNLGFVAYKDFVLEPTALKKSLRSMTMYRLQK